MKLYKYQSDILNKLKPYNKVALYMEAGTGKTATSSHKAVAYNVPIIVVAPKAVCSQWIEHFKSVHPEWLRYDLTKKQQLKDFINGEALNKIGIITYGLVWRRPELLKLSGYTLILDESHNICNATSKQTKGVMKLKYDNLILLSGTPNGGAYEKLYTQMKMLGYKPNKKQFTDRYCNMFTMESGGVKFKVLSKKNPYKNLDELNKILREDLHCVFLKTNDVIELPEQRFIDIAVGETKQYRAFMVNDYIDLGDREYIAGSPTEKLLYSRYLCGADNSNKIDVLTTLIEGIEDRVIIFYNFNNEHDVLTKLCKKLKRKAFTCNGNVKQVDEFKKCDKSVLLAQIDASGTGLNLQECNKIIYFSPTTKINVYLQSTARIWRVGQRNNCTYWRLISGVEKNIYNSLSKGEDFTLKLFKGGENNVKN